MNASTGNTDDLLREALKRCPPSTYEAARRFRVTGDCAELSVIIRGVIERFVERDRRAQLHTAGPGLRLIEDLGIDSLTMMEIVMLAEEALPLSISNEDLRHLRTLGEVEQFITSKLHGQPPPKASGSANWYLDDPAARKEPAAAPPPPRTVRRAAHATLARQIHSERLTPPDVKSADDPTDRLQPVQ
jgi:acyl carrier protein